MLAGIVFYSTSKTKAATLGDVGRNAFNLFEHFHQVHTWNLYREMMHYNN